MTTLPPAGIQSGVHMRNSSSRAVGGLLTFLFIVVFAGITGVGLVAAFALTLAVIVAIGLIAKPGELRIEADETVVYPTIHPSGPLVWFRYAITLGLYEFWRKATCLTVTDRRVIYHAGLISKTERTLPLHFLQDASLRTVLGSSYVSFSTAGREAGFETFGPCWPEQARSLKDTIVDRARVKPRTAVSAPPPPSSGLVEQLRSLQQLRDEGALSPDEFATAKVRVLQGQTT